MKDNIQQIRNVIRTFFMDYDMEDIYKNIEDNITMEEIKIISQKHRESFSVKERIQFSFVTNISLKEQIQNFSDKVDLYLDIDNIIIGYRNKAIEVYNNENSTEEELLNACENLFLFNLNSDQIKLFKESIIGIAINSNVDELYYDMFLRLYNKVYNKYYATRAGMRNNNVFYSKSPNMLIAAGFHEANGYKLESLDGDVIDYMKLLKKLQPETEFIKGLYSSLGLERKVMLMDYIEISDND